MTQSLCHGHYRSKQNRDKLERPHLNCLKKAFLPGWSSRFTIISKALISTIIRISVPQKWNHRKTRIKMEKKNTNDSYLVIWDKKPRKIHKKWSSEAATDQHETYKYTHICMYTCRSIFCAQLVYSTGHSCMGDLSMWKIWLALSTQEQPSDYRGCSCGLSAKHIFHVLRSPMQLRPGLESSYNQTVIK